MEFLFEWDPRKARRNVLKHGVTFQEASSVFGDPHSITIEDPLHSTWDEPRYIILGQSERQRILVVVHTEQVDRIRIISARKATPTERREYEEGD